MSGGTSCKARGDDVDRRCCIVPQVPAAAVDSYRCHGPQCVEWSADEDAGADHQHGCCWCGQAGAGGDSRLINRSQHATAIDPHRNESVPIQLAQCWFPGLAISGDLFCSLAILDPRVGHTMDVLSPFLSVPCHSD